MAARKTQQETIPPTLSPYEGIRYLLLQIKQLEQHVISLPQNHPDVSNWGSTTKGILNQIFGQPNGEMHSKTSDFLYARVACKPTYCPMAVTKTPNGDTF
jgi:hypothetical protein